MRKGLLFFVLALVIGIAAFFVTRVHHHSERKGVLLDSMPELAWLRMELNLSDEQFDKASELHAAYRPTCEGMCRNIAEAHAKLETLARSGHGMSAELTGAIRDHARVHAECQQKMLEHLYQTAALLDDKQAARYLDIPHRRGLCRRARHLRFSSASRQRTVRSQILPTGRHPGGNPKAQKG